MGRLDGKIAFITGAARGQGRSHAIRLAQEGADIIAVDICEQIASVPYPMATPEDLIETAKEVEALDRRIFARQVDVRDMAALQVAFNDGVAELGGVDIVLANAGIAPLGSATSDEQQFNDVVAVNLFGVWATLRVAVPTMMQQGRGGAIVLTSSTSGLKGMAGGTGGMEGYTAAKHGVVGLMRSYAQLLAPHNIRVNTVHPTGVNTPMVVNDFMSEFLASVSSEETSILTNAMPVEMVEPVDISNAILWLVSDEARYVTGITVPVDAGYLVK